MLIVPIEFKSDEFNKTEGAGWLSIWTAFVNVYYFNLTWNPSGIQAPQPKKGGMVHVRLEM